jgi:hypothetical protein
MDFPFLSESIECHAGYSCFEHVPHILSRANPLPRLCNKTLVPFDRLRYVRQNLPLARYGEGI